MTETDRKTYWDSYYGGRDVPGLPSQFAVFMLGEYNLPVAVDIGCGSGRDTFFFRAQGATSIGLDGSDAAIASCTSKARARGLDRLSFHTVDIADPALAGRTLDLLAAADADSPALLYARFFVHAITDAEEDALLRLGYEILRRRGGVLGLEYRTIRDRSLQKVTPDHYRRFVDPAVLIAKAARLGYSVDYAVEGFGMAKYRNDDAFVARTVLRL